MRQERRGERFKSCERERRGEARRGEGVGSKAKGQGRSRQGKGTKVRGGEKVGSQVRRGREGEGLSWGYKLGLAITYEGWPSFIKGWPSFIREPILGLAITHLGEEEAQPVLPRDLFSPTQAAHAAHAAAGAVSMRSAAAAAAAAVLVRSEALHRQRLRAGADETNGRADQQSNGNNGHGTVDMGTHGNVDMGDMGRGLRGTWTYGCWSRRYGRA
eukprot:4467099-Prymnesium_polylepis.1